LLELTDPSFDANQIYFELGYRGILVRICDSFYGVPKGRFLRVAVRAASENERLVDLLSVICAARSRQTDHKSPATKGSSGSTASSIWQPVSDHELV
jgi:hypothetical protein